MIKKIKKNGFARSCTEFLITKLHVDENYARQLICWLQKVIHPISYIKRRLHSEKITVPIPETLQSKSYMPLDVMQSEAEKLVSYLEGVYNKKKVSLPKASLTPVHVFDYNLTDQGPYLNNIEEIQPVLDFLSDDKILGLVSKYIGEAPILGNVSFLYSDISSEVTGGKSIHRDVNAPNRMHLILLVSDVDETAGPFTYLEKHRSEHVTRMLNYKSSSLTDEEFYKHVSQDEMMRFIGNKGDVLLINPNDCFHFGGRCEEKPRLILIASYTSAFAAEEERLGLSRLINKHELKIVSENQRILLNI